MGQLRGTRRCVEVLLLAVSQALWLAPLLAIGWIWLPTYALAQALAGVYLALAIAPNHKGMPTWAPGTAPAFVERQVRGSRNIGPGLVTDFVFGGLNHQIEHHLFPTMPRVHFRRARALVRPFCAELGLPYLEVSAFESYAQVYAELQRVGCSAAS